MNSTHTHPPTPQDDTRPTHLGCRSTRSAPRRRPALAVRFHRALWSARHRLRPVLKRGLDVTAASVLLVLLSPFLAPVCLYIRFSDGGPAFYKQWRIGRGGERFLMWKLRTMRVHTEAERARLAARKGGTRFKMQADPRITPIGRFLRKASIDELPQLWNVIKGDMSLVGPRPPLAEEVNLYDEQAWRRLDVRPGITCTWQVRGRSDIPFDQQVQLDLDYVGRAGLRTDLAILLATVPAVITGRGAY